MYIYLFYCNITYNYSNRYNISIGINEKEDRFGDSDNDDDECRRAEYRTCVNIVCFIRRADMVLHGISAILSMIAVISLTVKLEDIHRIHCQLDI